MVSFSSPTRKEPFLVLQCKIPGEWLYPSVGCDILLETWPFLERARGTKWPRPADSTTCSQDCLYFPRIKCHIKFIMQNDSWAAEHLLSLHWVNSIRHRSHCREQLFGDWFQSLALDFTCIFKVKGLSQCRDCTILCILKKPEVGSKLGTRTGRGCWKLPVVKSLTITITYFVKKDQTHKPTENKLTPHLQHSF